ncbi:MAG TPA: DMT family transporter [Actinomycetota bacterium]|nr:DMT family transporter [Actinomycetota bacterium]
MFPLLLALIAGLSWGSADFVGGLMTRRFAPATVLVVGQAAGLLFTAGLVVALGEPPPEARFLVYGGLGGLAGAIGLASLYKGLAVGRMSIVAPIAALSGVVPVIAGFAQGERPGAVQLAGMAIAGVGIVLAVRSPAPDHAIAAVGPDLAVAPVGDAGQERRRATTAGFGYALSAAVFLGFLVTSLDAAGDASPVWATMMVRLVSVPLFVVAWFVRGRGGPALSRRDVVVLAVVGLFDNGANVLFAIAAREGLLSLVSVLGSLYPVSTVLLARVFLHERLGRIQTVGVAAAFVGVALIAVG